MTEITVVGAGGEYMESVVVVEWHKKLGDAVRAGELLVTVETAKAATEIEATEDGVLSEIRANVGDEVPVGSVLGVVGDSVADNSKANPSETVRSEVSNAVSPEVSAQTAATKANRVIASPLARRVADQRNIDLSKVKASSESGRIKLRDVEAYFEAVPVAKADIPLVSKAFSEPLSASAERASKLTASLHIQRRGQQGGEKIVFLHGFGGDSLSWQPLLGALGGNFDCILVDLPGHGRSPRPDGGMTVQEIAEAVSQALSEAGVDEFHLVGHSLGGAVGLALLEGGRHVVRSITLLAPAGLGPEIDGGFVKGFARASQSSSLSPWVARLFANPALASPAFVSATMQARTEEALREAQTRIGDTVFPDGTQAADLRSVLKAVQISQKIIWGEQDRIIPMQHALRTGGRAALHFLPGVGHMPQVEVPADVARLLTQNIRSAY